MFPSRYDACAPRRRSATVSRMISREWLPSGLGRPNFAQRLVPRKVSIRQQVRALETLPVEATTGIMEPRFYY